MESDRSVKVWDPMIRIFHWGLVFFFLFSYISSESESPLHAWSGYAVGALLLFRLVWGFVGPKHARFKDFIFSPSEIAAYAKGLLAGDAKRHLGHNPLGGLMVFALLFSLAITTVTGMMVYGAEEGKGPLAGVMANAESVNVDLTLISTAQADDDWEEYYQDEEGDEHESEVLEELHEFFANFTVLLIMIHLIGVFVESVFHKESLVRAMVNGKKRQDGHV